MILKKVCGDDISWSTFWSVKGHCSVTVICAIVPLTYSFFLALSYLLVSVKRSSGRGNRGYGFLDDDPTNNFEGGEETRGEVECHLGDTRTWKVDERGVVDRHERINDQNRDRISLKKGTGVHFIKLLLYVQQVLYHVCLGSYHLFGGDADNPYKYIGHGLLTLTWIFQYLTEIMHHGLLDRSRNSLAQAAFAALIFGFQSWEVVEEDRIGHLREMELKYWNLVVLGIILMVELWSCIRLVPIKEYKWMNSEYSAGLWSFLSFGWVSRIVDTGCKRPIRLSDLPELVDADRAASIWSSFSTLLYPKGISYISEEGENLNLSINIVKLSGKRLLLQGVLILISVVMSLLPCAILNYIMRYIEKYDPLSYDEGVHVLVFMSIVGLCASQVIMSFSDVMMLRLGKRLGIRVRSALVSAVFHKAMSMDMSMVDAGKLQNLISVDAEAVLNAIFFQVFLWSSILRVLSSVLLLFWVLGVSAISGVVLIFLCVPVNNSLMGRLKTLQRELMKRRDKRMSALHESLGGIRIIKLFAWEANFLSKIFDARRLEVVVLRSYMIVLGFSAVLVKTSPTLLTLVTFMVHTKVLNYELNAVIAFTAVAINNQLFLPLFHVPSSINFVVQARASIKRLEAFLSCREGDLHTYNNKVGEEGFSNRHCSELACGQVRVTDGFFCWRQLRDLNQPTLSNINIDISPGQLVCIYGPTGAGKSSLLMALLNELVTIKGRASMNGTVAYASQRAWIQNATVRDNILFGCPYDEERYNMVLEACALKPDLEILEGGDLTEIGEKGINLSGGQQQRVSLARAVYNDADILLLDDVLSAVDSYVGKHLFDKCICKVLRGKTCVLVTHQVRLTAPHADQIIVMDNNGTIKKQGTYSEVKASGMLNMTIKSILSETSSSHSDSGYFMGDTIEEVVKVEEVNGRDNNGTRIIETEKREVGSPKASLYFNYFRSCGGGDWFGVVYMLLTALWQVLFVSQGFTLKSWVIKMEEEKRDGGSANGVMWTYILVCVSGITCLLLRTLLATFGSLNASKVVHRSMAMRVFGAPLGWYDATPLGRIFNRFSSDLVLMDKDVMNDISAYVDTLLGIVGVISIIVVFVPSLTVVLIPLLGISLYIARRYLKTAQSLKRLEAVSRSPLYAQFGESINGIATIRAYEAQEYFIKGSEERMNAVNRAHLYLFCTTFWLANRLRIVGSFVSGLVGVYVVAQVKTVDSATAGLVITYAFMFTVNLVFSTKLYAQMEMSVNSIERLEEYTKLPQEAAAVVPEKRPPGSWPSMGEVNVENLTLKYDSSSKPVLHGISFHVPSCTHVGIVGRTGAGKSSLVNALFRLVEAQPGSSVTIDGLDILGMGLEDLRRHLAIIPQDPTLFEGTIRSNVDPFNDYSDSQVWDALKRCQLHSFTASQADRLQHPVSLGGSNLSVGQQQLMCMARALLKRAAVLVMDEATANVDPETDALIQEAMKEGFEDCTILCVAHRLHTVAYYDQVLVLDKGKVIEYDTPINLLKDKGSVFWTMCNKTGDLDNLVSIAEDSSL